MLLILLLSLATLTTATNTTTATTCTPSFFLIGATKAGSTALWSLITSHPSVAKAVKEPHRLTYRTSGNDYRPCVNSTVNNSNVEFFGDGTPEYIFPEVAERAYKKNPSAKIMAVVRDPVDRAVSHHRMALRGGGFEAKEVFEEAIEEELRCYGLRLPERGGDVSDAARKAQLSMSNRTLDRLLADFERCSLRNWTGLEDLPHVRNKMGYPALTGTYLSRGMYAPQLARWERVFVDGVLVVGQKELGDDPKAVRERVYDYLGLEKFEGEEEGTNYRNAPEGGYRKDIEEGTVNILEALFKPYNEMLPRELLR